MLKLIIIFAILMVALQSTSHAQTIQNGIFKSYFAAPINDTIILSIVNYTMTISNIRGMAIVKSTVYLSNDTISVTDFAGRIKYSAEDKGMYIV